jgi:hypothetical protein
MMPRQMPRWAALMTVAALQCYGFEVSRMIADTHLQSSASFDCIASSSSHEKRHAAASTASHIHERMVRGGW